MQRFKLRTAAALALCGAFALPGGAATAQSMQSTSDQWRFNAILYAYLPTIGGDTHFPAGTGSSISVSTDTILDNLKFAFMGTFEAQKGKWGFFTDLMYLDVGGSKSNTRDFSVGGVTVPGGVTADFNLDVKGTIWTIAGTYRVVDDRSSKLDVFAGARYADIKEKFGYNLSADIGPIVGPGRSGGNEQKIAVWDGIIGAKGRLSFGERNEWFVPYYVDVGTGESDLTWQAIGGIGYSFGWGDVMAVWRYLDYDFGSDKKVESINFNGPAIGVAFRW